MHLEATSHYLYEESFGSSASSKALKPQEIRRKRAAQPATSRQIYNAENQSKQKKLFKAFQSMIETSTTEHNASFEYSYEVVLLEKRTVKSPRQRDATFFRNSFCLSQVQYRCSE